MERHKALHLSYLPALIKLDAEKVSALSGRFQITPASDSGVTVRVKADACTGKWEPSISTEIMNRCILNGPYSG